MAIIAKKIGWVKCPIAENLKTAPKPNYLQKQYVLRVLDK